MIAKIMKGSDFKGVVYYILNDGKGTQIIDADGLFLENNDTIAQGFIGQARMNPGVTKAVGHIAIGFSKEDEPRLDNAHMVRIAREYMEKMGIRNTQYIIGRHFDKEHPHVHIAFNRIDNNGKTISDRNDRFRSGRICKELTRKYGLHFANGKEQVKTDRLREPDRTSYELYGIPRTEVDRCGNWDVLVANLKRQAQVRPQAYQEEISFTSGNSGDLVSGSLGLLTPDNRPEEQQPYDPYLRNRKKKKQRKINW